MTKKQQHLPRSRCKLSSRPIRNWTRYSRWTQFYLGASYFDMESHLVRSGSAIGLFMAWKSEASID